MMNRQPHNLSEVVLLGFKHTPKAVRQTIIAHWLCMTITFLLYLFFNGGLVPWFMAESKRGPSPGGAIVDAFPITDGDGSKVKWAHKTNTIQELNIAAADPTVMMIEGDVMLFGQGSSSQKLAVVMANSYLEAQGDGSPNFQDWLKIVLESGKGMKLHFRTVEPLELALQILKEHDAQIKQPLILSADIIPGPNWQEADFSSIDSVQFFRLTNLYFPHASVGVGWLVGKGSERHYSWHYVKKMHDAINHRINRDQPVSIVARAPFVKTSLRQLKWLSERFNAPIILTAEDDDNLAPSDFHVIRNRMPANMVYYDLHSPPESVLTKKETMAEVANEIATAAKVFDTSQWTAVRKSAKDIVFRHSEAALLRHGLLISNSDLYKGTKNERVIIKGRVEFVDIPSSESKRKELQLGVNLHTSVDVSLEEAVGLMLRIHLDGRVIIDHITPGRETTLASTAIKETSAANPMFHAYYFRITESTEKKIHINVEAENLVGSTPTQLSSVQLEASLQDLDLKHKRMALLAPGKHGFVAIDVFYINSDEQAP